jgi:hypothetical protein
VTVATKGVVTSYDDVGSLWRRSVRRDRFVCAHAGDPSIL